jgi:hypothetical protein
MRALAYCSVFGIEHVMNYKMTKITLLLIGMVAMLAIPLGYVWHVRHTNSGLLADPLTAGESKAGRNVSADIFRDKNKNIKLLLIIDVYDDERELYSKRPVYKYEETEFGSTYAVYYNGERVELERGSNTLYYSEKSGLVCVEVPIEAAEQIYKQVVIGSYSLAEFVDEYVVLE